jgi:hypothetical protein
MKSLQVFTTELLAFAELSIETIDLKRNDF